MVTDTQLEVLTAVVGFVCTTFTVTGFVLALRNR
jgi:hypothetical protein